MIVRILVIENLNKGEESWWWPYLPPASRNCQISKVNIPERKIFSAVLSLIKIYFRLSDYDVVITHQDGYATFVISFLNTLLRRRKCRQFVNAFMTREKSESFYSRLKFSFLKFSLSSVWCLMCSSRMELNYYKNTLGFKNTRFEYVPLATNPKFIEIESNVSTDYIISSGRTGRDYATLLKAIRDIPLRLILVCDHNNVAGLEIPSNVEVRFNIPLNELIKLESSAKFVVLPLQDRMISIGQSVLLQVMALGKAVIATKNAGTIDYFQDNISGIFVEPGDVEDLNEAILDLMNNPPKAQAIGKRAREIIKEKFLISSKIKNVARIIKNMNSLK